MAAARGDDSDDVAAARYIHRLESGRIAAEVSDRLFYQAPKKHAQTLHRIELDMYPPEARVSRSRAELDSQVERLYERSVAQQKKNLAKAERSVYGECPKRYLDPKQQTDITNRMYKVPFTKAKKLETENASKTMYRPPVRKSDKVKEREDAFKTQIGHIAYTDSKQLLVCAAPPKPQFVQSPRKDGVDDDDGGRERIDAEEFRQHLAKLARPLAHSAREKHTAPMPSTFSMHTKFRAPRRGVGPSLR